MQNTLNKEWFESWFDSPYYPILYKKRDNKEAELFIDKLLDYLKPTKNSTFLDLGCGRGRHAIYLNKKGYNVTGIDLSVKSIDEAKLSKNDNLNFFVHDMRQHFNINKFDYVFNLFTSFGYFDSEEDDLLSIANVSKSMNPDGYFVLDFMNIHTVKKNLPLNERKNINGIAFSISKKIENNFIKKHISIIDKGHQYEFEEKVKLISLENFKKYFELNGLKIIDIMGNYELQSFDKEKSDRLILIAKF